MKGSGTWYSRVLYNSTSFAFLIHQRLPIVLHRAWRDCGESLGLDGEYVIVLGVDEWGGMYYQDLAGHTMQR